MTEGDFFLILHVEQEDGRRNTGVEIIGHEAFSTAARGTLYFMIRRGA